ncbi:MAG: histidine/lysine/arginine/ornithine ABC transporter ATP-binding protein [Neptuniibacter caesariensis]|uniref:Histidine/lysine/arginine/ornithine ABC transporter ATP-binding protein n=1 Tax=Neptuniibacter caesariensis TaxID=207954 RepID=A0A2G6JS66_NEPCE|nr:MAG: histidine/lysine/arginine/ornithine ABC transporter ATP-binding protein [Neptuniibacter caesariensis]
MTDANIALEIKDLHKSYGSLEVLKGISLTAKVGDVISIIGSSGSGKSTFLRCLNLLENPSAGEISFSGEKLKLKPSKKEGGFQACEQKQLERMRASIGFVFQNFNLWPHMTVIENIMEAPVHVLKMDKATARTKAMEYLNKVGLADKMDNYPNQLSGGQQQRIAIARALAMEPEVLLFDEPTSALDPELVGEVLSVMRNLAAEGRTMLIVTHEMRFAREVSSQIVFLHEGQVEESGTPDKVFTNPDSDRCRAFIGSQF